MGKVDHPTTNHVDTKRQPTIIDIPRDCAGFHRLEIDLPHPHGWVQGSIVVVDTHLLSFAMTWMPIK
jgi:hypothetical protein